MNLFAFFKPATKSAKVPIVFPGGKKRSMEKTQFIASLFKIPQESRDDNWRESFQQYVWQASFISECPQLLKGADGFTYFILKTPGAGEPAQSFCLQYMTDDFLLQQGWGVVFNPAKDGSAECFLTYGDIVNLHVKNKCLLSEDQEMENIEFTRMSTSSSYEDEKVFIAEPPEQYLPKATKNILKAFLESQGIKTPKLMLLTYKGKEKSIKKIALNIHPENYPASGRLDNLMQQVCWFFPANYILVPLPKRSELAAGFRYL